MMNQDERVDAVNTLFKLLNEDRVEFEVEKIKAKFDNEKYEIAKLQGELHCLKMQMSESADNHAIIVKRLKDEINELTIHNAAVENSLDDANKEIEDLTAGFQDKMNQIKLLEMQVKCNTPEEYEMTNLKHQVIALQGSNKALESAKSELYFENRKVKKRAGKLEWDNFTLRNRIKDLKNAILEQDEAFYGVK